MQFDLDEDHREFLAAADRFARQELYPLAARLDAEERWLALEWPGIGAFNFMLERALGGVASLRDAPQGKGRSQLLREAEVAIPAALTAGREDA